MGSTLVAARQNSSFDLYKDFELNLNALSYYHTLDICTMDSTQCQYFAVLIKSWSYYHTTTPNGKKYSHKCSV